MLSYISELGNHWFRLWLVTFLDPTITWTNADLLWAWVGTSFHESIFKFKMFWFNKTGLKLLLIKWWRFCSALIVLTHCPSGESVYIDDLVQERRNSSALAIKSRLSCTNLSIWHQRLDQHWLLIFLSSKTWDVWIIPYFLAATKQLYEWFSPSVRPSVRHTFLAATKQLYKWYFPSVRLSACLSHLFSCDQAALWMVLSVCPSVCLFVCPSHLFDYVTIIVSS